MFARIALVLALAFAVLSAVVLGLSSPQSQESFSTVTIVRVKNIKIAEVDVSVSVWGSGDSSANSADVSRIIRNQFIRLQSLPESTVLNQHKKGGLPLQINETVVESVHVETPQKSVDVSVQVNVLVWAKKNQTQKALFSIIY